MTETWRPVVGWERSYEVSSGGRVRSIDRLIVTPDGQRQLHRGRMLPGRDKAGYVVVHLRDGEDGRHSHALVHRLVAQAFIPNPEGKPSINHIDFNPANNSAANLEWCSQKENLHHSRIAGRMPSYWKGKRASTAVFADDEIRNIRAQYAAGGQSFQRLADAFGVSKRTIDRIINRRYYADVQ